MIEFSTDFPQISGTWVNPKNGHRFTVKDCYFEDSDYKIYTTDGTTISYNMMQDYIQDTGISESGDKLAPVVFNNSNSNQDIPLELMEELGDFGDNIGQNIGLQEFIQYSENTSNKEVPKNTEFEIIDRVFSKLGTPKLDIQLTFKKDKDFRSSVDMLLNQLDVTKEQLLQYVMDKYVISNEKMVKGSLNKILFKSR